VKARGDTALIELSRSLDRIDLDAIGMRVTSDEMRQRSRVTPTLSIAELCAERIAVSPPQFGQRALMDELGVELGWRGRR